MMEPAGPSAEDQRGLSPPEGTSTPTIRHRRRARMLAFQALYESDVSGHSPDAVLQRLYEELYPHAEVLAYASELVAGVMRNRLDIDTRIRRYATALPFEQMAAVDRGLLRLGVFEAIHNSSTIPVGVAIDEAIELAKLYGSESSRRFINGVLGRIVAEGAPSRSSPGPG